MRLTMEVGRRVRCIAGWGGSDKDTYPRPQTDLIYKIAVAHTSSYPFSFELEGLPYTNWEAGRFVDADEEPDTKEKGWSTVDLSAVPATEAGVEFIQLLGTRPELGRGFVVNVKQNRYPGPPPLIGDELQNFVDLVWDGAVESTLLVEVAQLRVKLEALSQKRNEKNVG